jgi:hypothetical protein
MIGASAHLVIGKNFRSQSSFSFLHTSTATNVSAPDRTAQTATPSNFTNRCSTFFACLGSRTPTQTSSKRTVFSAFMENPKKTENYTNQRAVNSAFVTT